MQLFALFPFRFRAFRGCFLLVDNLLSSLAALGVLTVVAAITAGLIREALL